MKPSSLVSRAAAVVAAAAAPAKAAAVAAPAPTAKEASKAQVFEMTTLTKVEMNGVEYAPGKPIKVEGIQTARWLEQTRSARFGAPDEEPSSSDTQSGTHNESSSSSGT